VYCFLFISIVCLYVNVWSVEYEQFEDFAAVEDFQDPEQFPELVRQVLATFPLILLQHAF
jgi:hypothetical protein